MYAAVRDNIRTCANGEFGDEKEWDILGVGGWDPLGPFTARQLIQGVENGSLNPMNVCKNRSAVDAQRVKDALNYANHPMPEGIGIANEDLMLIPKFFLDKEDPELALKMERTLASADDYGS
jgi:hypothetical protein